MKKELILIAREAGKTFLKRPMTSIVAKEGHANYVTNIDCMVQEYLEKSLLQLLPGSLFIGEEKENQALTDAPTWVVDPLDGTTNMIHDYHLSAVSIALCREKKPVLGLIWQPYTQELFYAEAGADVRREGLGLGELGERLFRAVLAHFAGHLVEELPDLPLGGVRQQPPSGQRGDRQ